MSSSEAIHKFWTILDSSTNRYVLLGDIDKDALKRILRILRVRTKNLSMEVHNK
jgi:hypothetical protein